MYYFEINIWKMSISYCIGHIAFLLVAGVSGIVLSYLVLQFLTRRRSFPWLMHIGFYTFSIYMVQGILFNVIFRAWQFDLHYQFFYWLAAIVITYAVWNFVRLIAHSKILSLLLLGKTNPATSLGAVSKTHQIG